MIKNLIEKIDNKPGEYGKDYMKIQFNPDGNLPLNKPFKFHNLTITVTSVFQENNKYHPQIFLDECLYDASEGIDLNKASTSKECMIYHYWYFKGIGYKYKQYF